MLIRYTIYAQYEYWSKEGIKWTDWFRVMLCPFYKTEAEAKAALKEKKATLKNTDKRAKLKHKYEIRAVDIETLPVPTLHFHKKGRPSKLDKEQLKIEQQKYWIDYADAE